MAGYEARSAGTSKAAKRVVTAADITWANVILVMERKHSQRLRARFGSLLRHKRLVVLGVPDDYQFMDPVLVEILKERVHEVLHEGESEDRS